MKILVTDDELEIRKVLRLLLESAGYEVCEAVKKKVKSALSENPTLTSLVVAGGVAANSHLRAVLTELCERAGIQLYIPPLSLCGDNAAMIGAQGYFEYMNGARADSSLNASALDSI